MKCSSNSMRTTEPGDLDGGNSLEIWQRLSRERGCRPIHRALHLDENLANEVEKLRKQQRPASAAVRGAACGRGLRGGGARVEEEPQPRRCTKCGKEVGSARTSARLWNANA